jgi:PPOX class probable FMN-dependent enzyme
VSAAHMREAQSESRGVRELTCDARASPHTPHMPAHRLTAQVIETETALRDLIGDPAPIVCAKIIDRLLPETRQFIEQAPFLCLSTSDEHGNCDVSPRGDPRGFVRILDERTLLIPERPGNRLADSLRNILRNPHAALLFVIPGVSDTFRVNGRATLTTDPRLLEPCQIEGKVPKLGILIDIEEAYTQCSKAFLRSQLWDPSQFIARERLPSGGQIARAIQGSAFDAEKYDRERAARYARREGFY